MYNHLVPKPTSANNTTWKIKMVMVLICAHLWQIVSEYIVYLIYTTANISSSSSNIHSSMTDPFSDDEVAI